MGFPTRSVLFYYIGEREPLTAEELREQRLDILIRIIEFARTLWNTEMIASGYPPIQTLSYYFDSQRRIGDLLINFGQTISLQIDVTALEYHRDDIAANKKSAAELCAAMRNIYHLQQKQLARV